jgi:hypothetical protein
MLLNMTSPEHASRIADYLSEGYSMADYFQDQTYRCDECGAVYDHFSDGRMRASDCKWHCTRCIEDAAFQGDVI